LDPRNGNVITTGWYTEEIDFDPGGTVFYLSPTGDISKNDIFILTLNSSGEFVSAYTLGGPGNDFGNNTLVDENGNYFISANFAETAGFSPGQVHTDSITSVGGTDAVLVKWKLCEITFSEITPDTCGPYTSPSGKYTWYETGVYLDTILNAGGCDSILTINFFFMGPQMSIVQQGNLLLAQGNPEIAYWLDCDNGFNLVGTGYVLFPPANGNYAVVGESFQCIDTSECFAFVMTNAEDFYPKTHFSIYPNPVENLFYLDLHQSYKHAHVTIYDPRGRIIHSQFSTETRLIPFSVDLPSGIYFIRIIADRSNSILKFIVE
jgi:hypothetical protein